MDSLLEKNLISTKDASELSGYSADYLCRLVKAKKIRGIQIGRTWLIEHDSLLAFLEVQSKLRAERARTLSEIRSQEYRASKLKQAAIAQPTQADTLAVVPDPLIASPYVPVAVAASVGRSSFLLSEFAAVGVAVFVVALGAYGAESGSVQSFASSAHDVALEAAGGFRTLALTPRAFVPQIAASAATSSFTPDAAPVTAIALPDHVAVFTSVALAPHANKGARAVPAASPQARGASQSIGEDALALGVFIRDALALAPQAALHADLAFAGALVNGTHMILGTYESGAVAYASAAPEIPRTTALALADLGARTAEAVGAMPRVGMNLAAAFNGSVLALARGIVGTEVAVGGAMQHASDASARVALAPFQKAGELAYDASLIPERSARIQDTGRALAVLSGGIGEKLGSAAAPAAAVASASENGGFFHGIVALVGQAIENVFDASVRALAYVLEPVPPTAHAPQVALGTAPVAVASTNGGSSASGTTNNYYATNLTVTGVSQAYVDQRVSDLQTFVYANLGSLAQSVSRRSSGGSSSSGGGSGSVTSVDASGGTTGFSFTGGPITSTGTLTLAGVLDIDNGGTGIATAPTYGQLLLGNNAGGYDLVATSSLGIAAGGNPSWGDIIGTLSNQTDLQNALDAKLSLANWYATTTDGLDEGTTNFYFTNARADARFVTDLAATSSVASITTLPSLVLPYSQLTGTPTFENPLTFTYPLVRSTNTISLAFGTTTSNTWGGTQTFTNAPILGALSGLVGANNGTLYQIATSTNFVTAFNGRTGAVSPQAGDYTTSIVAEGSNLYFTNDRFDNRLSATTSLPNITTLASLSLPLSQTTGVLPITKGGTGTSTVPAANRLLLSDASGNWEYVATSSLGIVSGGAPVWGTITGTLSNQTDLQNALDAKLSLANWYATTTDGLDEGLTNFYFTNARADARFVTDLAATSSVASITTLPSLVLPVSQLTGTLGVANGGTGVTTLAPSQLVYGNGTNALTSVATSSLAVSGPLSYSGTFGALVGGAGGTISISQANGSTNGYLSSADFNIFNSKISSTSLSAIFPLAYNSATGAFTFGGLTTSTPAVQGNIAYFSGANTFANVATTSLSANSTLTVTGTLGSLIGGSNSTIALNLSNPNTWTALQQFANASSTLLTAPTAWITKLANLATAGFVKTAGDGTLSVDTNTYLTSSGAVTSLQQTYGTAQTGAITLATSSTAINGDWGITNSGGTFTFNLPTASASVRGLLSSADWSTFNGKQAALSFTYPLVNSANTISLAFGTSTSNTWGGTQTFTNAPILGALSGLVGANNGTLYNVSTSSLDANITGNAGTVTNGVYTTTFGGLFYNLFHATTTDALAQGSINKYFTQNAFDSALSATTSLPNITTLANLSAISTSLTGFVKASAGVLSTVAINLASDITGILPVPNGGTGWGSLQANTVLLGNGMGAIATTSAGVNGQVLGLVGGVPTWVSTTTLATISGTLGPTSGGTGLTAYTTGDLLYADSTNHLTTLGVGSTGQVLKVQAGLPAWGVDQTVGGGGSDGIFATSTGLIYPLDTSQTLVIGSNSTSTATSIFEVHGNQYISGSLAIGTNAPSAFLDVAGDAFLENGLEVGGTAILDAFSGGGTQCLEVDNSGTIITSGTACGSGTGGITAIGPVGQTQTGSTITFATSTSAATGLTIGTTITGAGNTLTFAPTLSGILNLANGGTGLGSYSGNQILYTNAAGTALLQTSTSTLSIGGNAATATALQTARTINGVSFDGTANIVVASTTLLSDTNTFTGLNIFANASTTLLTAPTAWITKLANLATAGFVKTASDGTLSVDTNTYLTSATGVTRVQQTYGSAQAGAITLATSSAATSNGVTVGQTITNSGGTFTFNPTVSVANIPNGALQNSTISGVALGGTLGALTATNGTLTFSGSYDGSAAQTVGLNLANANTWTATQTFKAGTTNNTFGSNAAPLTVNASGSGHEADLKIGDGVNQGSVFSYYNGTTVPHLGIGFVTAGELFSLLSTGQVGIGTTTPFAKLSVAGDIFANGNITGSNITATGTLNVTGTATVGNFINNGLTANTIAYFNGSKQETSVSAGANGQVLALVNGVPSWVATTTLSTISGTLGVANGGTGQTSFTSSQLLYGNGTNGLSSVATTSFAAADSSLSVTGTLGALIGGSNSTIALNLGNANSWTALQTFANASSTLTTLGTTWFSGLTNSLLSTDANGKVVATTSIGVNYLTGTLGIANGGTGTSTGGVTNGVEYYDGSKITNGAGFTFNGASVGVGSSSPFRSLLTADAAGLASNIVPLTVKAQSGTATSIFQVLNSNGVAQAFVNQFGNFLTISGNNSLGAGAGTAPASGTYLSQPNAGINAFTVKEASGNNLGDSFRVLDSNNNFLAVIGAKGSITIGSSTDPTAWLSVAAAGASAFGDQTDLFHIASVTSATYASSTVFTVRANGNVGIGTTTPSQLLSVQGNALLSGNLSAANITATGTLNVSGQTTLATSLSGILKATAGVVSNAVAGTDYLAGGAGAATTTLSASGPLSLTANPVVFGSSPITLSLTQANGSTNGYLSSGDWTLFNNKISSSSLSAAYPLAYNSSTGTFTFNGLSTSTAAVQGNIPYFSGANTFANVATTSFAAANTTLSITGTLGAFVGGSNSTIALNLGNANSWTALQSFANASSTLFSSTYASSTNAFFGTETLPALATPAGSFLAVNASGTIIATSTPNLSALSGTLGVTNGGTGSTTLGGILAGNGTSPVKSVVVGSGLTWDGTTLAADGSGIHAIGPAGQTQTGSTQLLATTTSTTNGLTSALTITGASNTITFAPSLSGTLTAGGGGTGVTTFGGTNTLLYTTAADTLSSIATANNGVLVTSAGGVPSISSTLPTAVQNNISATNIANFSTAASSWISTIDTDSLAEGPTNQYFTNLRADTRANIRFIADLAATSSVSSITALPSLVLPTSQLTGTLGVANGGTGTTTGGVTNGIEYYNGTTLTNGSALTWNGASLSANGFINTDQYSGYKQNGNLLAYASSTNGSTIFGLGAGGQSATTSASHSITAIGYQALNAATGYPNTAVGHQALKSNTTGSDNVAVGDQALYMNLDGFVNNAFGDQALYANTSGNFNAAFGTNALSSNTTGANSAAFGVNALQNNTSATSSTALGYQAGAGTGNYNNQGGTYIGMNAGLFAGINSDYNTLIGYKAGDDIRTGYDNILIGAEVNTGGSHLTTGANNICIGYNCILPGGTSANNQLNIGNVIFGTSLTATSSGTTIPGALTGNIGIGTTTPSQTLSVQGSALLSGNLSAANITATGTETLPALATPAGSFLAVNGSGTIIATSTPSLSSLSGTLGVANGGTGSTTLTGILVGNGTSQVNSLTLPSFLSLTGSTLSLNTLGIANGGTGTTTGGVTNGVEYYDGSKLTNGSALTWDGTTLSANGFINTDQYSGYKQNGQLLAYASSTNQDTIFGLGAGGQNATTSATVVANTAIGYQALSSNTTGSIDTAIGYQASYKNTTAAGNTSIGYLALTNNTTGTYNVAIGYNALGGNISATTSVAIGESAGQGNGPYYNQGSVLVGGDTGHFFSNSSDYNTLIGYQAGYDVSTGNDNIIIGANVNTGGSHTTTGKNNILIGYNAIAPGGAAANNALNIGNFLFGTGLTATSSGTSIPASLSGKLGIGTSSPFATLSVAGNIFANSSITGSNITATGTLSVTGQTTLASSLTGLLKATAGVVSTAVAGTDYIAGGAGAATTTLSTSGALSFSANPVVFGSSPITLSLGTVGVANGGTGTSTGGVTNGVEYYDGTKLTNGAALTWDGSLLNITGNASTTQLTANGNLYVTSGHLFIGSAIASSPAALDILQSTNNSSAGLRVVDSTQTSSVRFWADTTLGHVSGGSGDALPLGINTEGTGNVLITGSGLVGIGTTSPFAKLSVAGNIFANGNITGANITATGTVKIPALATPAGSFLAVNASGTVIATTSPSLSTLTGTLGVANGGTGSTTLSGILVGNGTSPINTLTLPSFLSLTGSTLSLNTLGIANGGTGTTTGGVTNGVEYYDGATLTNGSALTWNGSLLNIAGNASSTQFTSTGSTYLATAGGAVGIGTTSPTYNLTVAGSGATSVEIDSGTTGSAAFLDFSKLSSVYGRISTPASTNNLQINAVKATGNLILGAGGANAQDLTITSGHLVGIGTTSPFAKLSVAGDIFANGNITGSNITATGTLSIPTLATPAGSFLAVNASGTVIATTSPSLSSLSGTLGVASGGTGDTTFTSSQLLYGNGTNALTSVATTSATLGLGLSYSGTLGALVGGSSGSLTIATSSLYTGTTGQFPYFSGTNTITATSSLFLAASGNIGVGSTTPWAQLSVNALSTSAIPAFAVGSSTQSTFVVTNGNAETAALSYASPLGLVGIGTTNPTGLLDINSTDTGNSRAFALYIENPSFSPNIGQSAVGPHEQMALTTKLSTSNGTNQNFFDSVGLLYGATDATGQPLFTLDSYNAYASGYGGPAISLRGGQANGAGGVVALPNSEPLLVLNNYTSVVDTFLAGGQAGIATTTPYFTLTVASSTGAQLSLTDASATSNPWDFRSINGALYIATSSPSTFATSSVAALSIDANGNLSLARALTVANGGTGATTFSSGQLVYGNGTNALTSVATTSATLGLGLSYSGTLGALVGGSSGNLTIATSSLYTGTTGQFPYFSGTNTITATSSLFLAASGKVGVGTAAPSALFSVGASSQFQVDASGNVSGGSLNASAGLTTAGSVNNAYVSSSNTNSWPYASASTAATVAIANFAGSGLDNSAAFVQFAAKNGLGTVQYSYIGGVSTAGASYGPAIVFGQQTGANSYQERLRIDSTGNVGVGTTSPSQALSVQGNALLSGNLSVANITATGTETLSALATPAGSFLAVNASGTVIATSSPSLSTLSGTLGVANGGTGDTTFTSSQLLYGNGTNALSSVATTSFGAANGTLTVTGTLGALVGGSNSTIALNLGNANTWTALQTFGNSSTTAASFGYASSTRAFFGTLAVTGNTSLATTTFTTQDDDGVHIISSATKHSVLVENSASGGAHISFCNADTGCTFTDGVDVGMRNTALGNTAVIRNNENAGIDFIVNHLTTAAQFDALGNLTLNQYGTGALSVASGVVSAGTLSISNGGTGTSTGGVTNGVEYYDGSKITNGTGFTFTGTKVGIGTTLPTEGLVVTTANSNAPASFLRSVASGNAGNNVSLGRLQFGAADNSTFAEYIGAYMGAMSTQVWTAGANQGSALVFAVTPNNSVTQSEAMRIDQNGFVGIGSTTPSQLLSVQGNALLSGNLNVANISATGTLAVGGTATVGNLIDSGITANSFIYLNGSQQLAAGTVSSPLSFTAGTLSLGTVGLANGGTATTTFYSGGVVFSDATKLTQSAAAGNFFWDETNKRLGLGTSTPWGQLSVNSNGLAAGIPQFVVGSSTRTNFIVANSGNVGIGTSSPYALLSIDANAAGIPTTESAVVIKGQPSINGNTNIFEINDETNTHQVYVNSSYNLLVNSGMNVSGVAGSAPAAGSVLVIQEAPGQSGFVMKQLSNGTADVFRSLSSANLFLDTIGAKGNITIGTSTDPTAWLSVMAPGSTAFGSQTDLFHIATVTSATYATTTIFTVGANGRVGIATTTPGTLLSIGGSGAGINFSTATSTFTGVGGINLTSGCYAIGGNCLSLSSFAGTLGIANGGTNATSQTTNGVNYFDGTKITSGAGLIYDGANLGINSPTLANKLEVGGSAVIGTQNLNVAAPANGLLVQGKAVFGATTTSAIGGASGPPAIGVYVNAASAFNNTGQFTNALAIAQINSNQTDGTYAANDYGEVNSAGATFITARIAAINTSHTAGSEAGELKFLTSNAGTLGVAEYLTSTNQASFGGSATQAVSNLYSTFNITATSSASTSLPPLVIYGNRAAYVNGTKIGGFGVVSADSGFGLGTGPLVTEITSLSEESQTTASQATGIGFYTTAAGGTATDTEKMYLSGAGKLGIGTTTPSQLLSVQGNALLSGDLSAANITATGTLTVGGLATAGSIADTGLTINKLVYSNASDVLTSVTLASPLSFNPIGGTLSLSTLGLGDGGTATTTFYSGGVVFSDATKLTQSAAAGNFFWDETNKRLGLGTTTPAGPLAVQTASNQTAALSVSNSAGAPTLQVDTLNSSGTILTVATSTGTSYFDVVSDGTINFNATKYASCTGFTTNASGVIQCSVSDQRLKQGITSLEDDSGLSSLMALNPVSYTFIDPNRPQGLQYGLIAQQVQQVFPNLVATSSPTALTPDGTLTVDYNGLFAPIIKSIQELNTRTGFIQSSTTGNALTVDALGNIGVRGAASNRALSVAGDAGVSGTVYAAGFSSTGAVQVGGDLTARSFVTQLSTTSFTVGSTTLTADIPSVVLTSGGAADIGKLATFALADTQDLAKKVDALSVRMDSLEDRLAKLESGAVGNATSTEFSTTTLTDALQTFGVYLQDGLAQFNSLVASRFVAAADSEGNSSAGSGSILAGNTIVEIDNAYAEATSKIIVTMTSPVDGGWYVGEKQDGSFRVHLSKVQQDDVTFDYFIVETAGQVNTPVSTTTPGQIQDNPHQIPINPPADDGSDTGTSTGTSTDSGPTDGGDTATSTDSGGDTGGSTGQDAAGDTITLPADPGEGSAAPQDDGGAAPADSGGTGTGGTGDGGSTAG